MKLRKATAYEHLASTCEVQGFHLELLTHKRGMTLRILRAEGNSIATPFSVDDPNSAAKRLMERL